MNLSELKALASAATKGPWLEREDYDYYQAGTYIGTGPYRYRTTGDPPNAPPKIEQTSPPFGYFMTSVCRVEGDEDKAFLLAFNPATALTLISALETAMRGLEKIVTPEHWHVDPITRSGCFQERAQEALAAVNEKLGER